MYYVPGDAVNYMGNVGYTVKHLYDGNTCAKEQVMDDDDNDDHRNGDDDGNEKNREREVGQKSSILFMKNG